ncbi:MAG TPA: ArsI/CadI family heavy metal resistance metalloenzyme [Caulobacteraceae bacterium]|jgi:catechol 2,3-dioxygenase-like lactoylglutathione lyase family enzyme|nr:ArsI/CadI family heavy metal resistance metalloenzyme [Caulobacteraceae bacterium]
MKRLHVHVAVEDLGKSIAFYSTLFGAGPVVVKDDYAKWMLEDPHVNFAISDRARTPGVDHLGIQVDDGEELAEIAGRLKAAGETTRDQTATVCCYAKSDKAWVSDPSGLQWETFYSFGAAPIYGEDDRGVADAAPSSSCCPAQPDAVPKACC